MQVTRIAASQDSISPHMEGAAASSLWVRELAPTVSPEPARQLALIASAPDASGNLVIPRLTARATALQPLSGVLARRP